jgi:hypothetical protein
MHRGDGAEFGERMTAMGIDVAAAPAGQHDGQAEEGQADGRRVNRHGVPVR